MCQVQEFILSIENREFDLSLSLEGQPDLLDIQSTYKDKGGEFWVALHGDKIIGTVALFNLGNHSADLRKMFVDQDYRGKQLGVAHSLYKTLLDWAMKKDFTDLFLETSECFQAAIKFYERNGWRRIEKEQLPPDFPVIKVATRFYQLKMDNQSIEQMSTPGCTSNQLF